MANSITHKWEKKNDPDTPLIVLHLVFPDENVDDNKVSVWITLKKELDVWQKPDFTAVVGIGYINHDTDKPSLMSSKYLDFHLGLAA